MAAAPAPRFSVARSLVYSAILVALFFGLLEGGLRLAGVRAIARPRLIVRAIDVDIDLPFMKLDQELFWSPRPGWRGEFQGWPVTINGLGLRGAEVALPKAPGRRRVVCFGDSITFGYGVGDTETYPYLVGQRLAAKGGEAVNAGVTGYTSHQVLGLARRLLPALEAEVATFCVGWNDAGTRPMDDREYARRVRASMSVEGILDRIALFSTAKAAYLRSGLVARDAGARRPRVAPLDYVENLRSMVEECRRLGVRPVFIALPRRRRPGEPPFVSPYPDLQREAARGLGVPLLVVPDLASGPDQPVNAGDFLDTLHLSTAGNARMAANIVDQLVALGLI
jgi:lysophospholipase L1-like esterase